MAGAIWVGGGVPEGSMDLACSEGMETGGGRSWGRGIMYIVLMSIVSWVVEGMEDREDGR